MDIETAEVYATRILNSTDFQVKKDGLDQYRGIITFLAQDILTDVRQYKQYNKWYQFRIRNGIQKQINKTVGQTEYYIKTLRDYIKQGWHD